MGDSKILLKEARKAIDSGDFETAVDKCKRVLKLDEKNYMALVLLGVALRDDEEAEAIFTRAIALKDNVLAYQGLAKFYDNKGTKEHLKSLIKLYYRMSTLSDINQEEIFESIYNTALKINDCNECGNMINDFLSKESGDRQNQLIVLLGKILTFSDGTIDKDSLSLFEKVLNVSDKNLEDLFFLKYFKCLLKVEGYKCMFKKFWEVRWEILILREWICETFVRVYVLKLYDDFNYKKIQSLVSGVIKEMPNSEYGKIAVIVLKLINNDKFNAYIEVCNYLKTNSKNKLVCLLQAICCIELSRYIEAESIVDTLVNDKDADVAVRSKNILLIAKLSQKTSVKCSEGIKIVENLNPINMEEMERIALFNAYIQLELFDKAKSCFEKLSASPAYHAKLLRKTGKIDEAIKILTKNKSNLLCKVYLGMYCMEKKEYKIAFKHLLESAKNYPFNFEIFLYLGDYYTLSGKNLEKAKKCYLKAFELNPECFKAGKNLSNTYVEMKEWDSNATFLLSLINSITQVSENPSNWPWLHLGLHYIALEQWDTAIVHLRTYIRLNSSDADAWETLADAYYHRGSYTSAMKCYKKAIEIDPKNKYCIVQIGTIQCLLGFFRDALSTYETITDDSFLPAVKGLAEVKNCIASDLLSQNLYGLCRDQAQEAINLISPSILMQHKLSCMWKILTDSIMIISKLPPKYNWLKFDGDFLFNNESVGLTKYEDKEILNLAILCVSKTIDLIEGSNAHLYHDLAAIYLALYEKTDEFQYAKKSYLSIIQCLETEKGRWQHWNLLGIICISKAVTKHSLAQHAFIKALELDPINAMLWSNLGVFYAVLGNNVLANQVFMKAQEANPTFIQSWIGQALIAESVGHHEAMDLFRHASQLGFHKESSLGYAYWVANSMIELKKESSSSLTYSIENMHALPAACDLMAWYNQFETKNPCSWNIYGLLLEKMGCFRNSVEAFKNALNYVEKENKDTVILNLVRGYANLKEYRNAIDIIISVEDIKSIFVHPLAFYFFECGEYENAYLTYNKILELTDNEKEKCDVLIAMANVAFKVDDMETAEILLLQSITVEDKLYIDGVVALCAFYLLRSDVDSAEAALNEVMKLDENAVKHRLPYFITLKSYCVLLREGPLAAVRSICKYIHIYPNAENLWKTAASIITKNVSISKMCIKKCLSFNNVVENMEYLKLACLTELSVGNYKKSKTYALKAIRLRPDNADNWALLLTSLLPNTSESSEVPFDKNCWKMLLKYVLENFKADKQLTGWLNNMLNMQCEDQ